MSTVNFALFLTDLAYKNYIAYRQTHWHSWVHNQPLLKWRGWWLIVAWFCIVYFYFVLLQARYHKNCRDTWMWHILLPLLCLTPPIEVFLWDDLHKILHRGQRMAKVQNGKEVLPKVSPWVGRTNVTEGFAIVTLGYKCSASLVFCFTAF